ncbi:TPA: formyltetrahydrofolate deformylase [Pseudomonas aeruginosa]|jgi:formyltetrahydrofolate deformylase|uniref:Formyltetrahydrofolate deformylase n=3 Tax=Pseudomonadaceae TaxID=135621 RepID=A4XY04_ECTM1|nr:MULTISPECIES: formyltetrahydrofolate deformylase [Pseudomonas]EIE43317.1 formyltetrahydrofolate deformylase [Pseudomonas aeruginosa PADK2_CF510]EIU4990027.1 formyltetrahydrofolate deformylase [Pseudomonas aeruginosa]EIY2605522.1 formyltetrahydrofolate deformylase [Pseudomonas aeruginosa]EIY2738089.1 formyltetrahydrofolate deformylase [Pseudomonas aeruginosa]EKM0196632.1 formyltetrahydrofolate deformylase [Pseudomonas aeruginosa]
MQHATDHFIIKISCPAASGIVAAVTTYLADRGCYISEMSQFDDETSGRFFMRAVFRFNDRYEGDIDEVEQGFVAVAQRFEMEWALHSTAQPMRVLLMVSKYDHCLVDLLYRHHKGELDMQITAIVSNHLELRPMAEREGIRFIYLPVTKDSKAQQEAALMKIVDETQTELVVLARYMQILSDDLCKQLSGRAINIHHSFLPGFKGAKPYHQAYERGVKLIGATAHYVTSDLDEGPIIEQEVQRVDHAYLPDDLVAIGRDTETVALSKAVKYHLEHRVFLNGERTVIFR